MPLNKPEMIHEKQAGVRGLEQGLEHP